MSIDKKKQFVIVYQPDDGEVQVFGMYNTFDEAMKAAETDVNAAIADMEEGLEDDAANLSFNDMIEKSKDGFWIEDYAVWYVKEVESL